MESKQVSTSQWKAGPGNVYYSISPFPLNWNDSKEWCIANGGIMAEPRSAEQTAAIEEFLHFLLRNSYFLQDYYIARYWIGKYVRDYIFCFII